MQNSLYEQLENEKRLSDKVKLSEAQTTGDFSAGVQTGVLSLRQLGAGAMAATGDILGNEKLQEKGVNKYLELEEKMAPLQEGRTTNLESIKGPGSAIDWAQYQLGNLTPSIAESIGTALIGASLGSVAAPGVGTVVGGVTGLTGKSAVKGLLKKSVTKYMAKGMAKEAAEAKAKKVAAQKAGAAVTLFASGYTKGVGDVYGETLDGKDGDAKAAFLYAVPYAAIDAITTMSLLGGVVKGSAGKSALGNYASAIASGALKEGAQESSQEAILIKAGIESGKEYKTDEVISRLANSFAAAALGGGVLGTAGGRNTQEQNVDTPSSQQNVETQEQNVDTPSSQQNVDTQEQSAQDEFISVIKAVPKEISTEIAAATTKPFTSEKLETLSLQEKQIIGVALGSALKLPGANIEAINANIETLKALGVEIPSFQSQEAVIKPESTTVESSNAIGKDVPIAENNASQANSEGQISDSVVQESDKPVADKFQVKTAIGTVKQIDEATKKELIQAIDYLRVGNKPKEKYINIEKTVSDLAQKFGVIQDQPSAKIANTFEKLVENTNTAEALPGTARETKDLYQGGTPKNEVRISDSEVQKQIKAIPFLKGLTTEQVEKILTPDGKEAFGKYRSEIISYVKNPDKTTLSHEAFHAFLDTIATDKQINDALALVKKEKPQEVAAYMKEHNATESLAAEEVLAQDFAEWFVSKKRPTNKLEQFLEFLKQKMKEFVGKSSDMDKLFASVLDPRKKAVKKQASPKDVKHQGKKLVEVNKKAHGKIEDAGLIAEAKKYGSVDEFVEAQGETAFHGGVGFEANQGPDIGKRMFRIKENTPVYRGEGEGIGNTTFVNGRYFADTKDFAETFGKVTKAEIPKGTGVFDFDLIKDGKSKIIPDKILVDPEELTNYLMDRGVKWTKNTNTRGVEYVELKRTPEYVLSKLARESKSYEDFISKATKHGSVERESYNRLAPDVKGVPYGSPRARTGREKVKEIYNKAHGTLTKKPKKETETKSKVNTKKIDDKANSDNTPVYQKKKSVAAKKETKTKSVDIDVNKTFRSAWKKLYGIEPSSNLAKLIDENATTIAKIIKNESFKAGKIEGKTKMQRKMKSKLFKQKKAFALKKKSIMSRFKKKEITRKNLRKVLLQLTKGFPKEMRNKLLSQERVFNIKTGKELSNILNTIGDMQSKVLLHEELKQMKKDIAKLINDKRIKNEENLIAAMKLPTIKNMDMEQLTKFIKLIEEAEIGDVFIGKRQLQTVEKTELGNIKTWREAREKLAERLGVNIEDIKPKEATGFDNLRHDNSLAEKDPFYKMMVEDFYKETLVEEERTLLFEKDMNKLLKAARKSRPRTILQRLFPTDKKIFEYLGSDKKSELAGDMTIQELEAAEFIADEYVVMRNELVQNKTLEKYIKNYITHKARGFFEAWIDDSFTKAIKGIFKQQQQDEAVFNIVSDTGKILPLDKHFRFSMKRTGGIEPTKNVGKAVMAYRQAFGTKRALDRFMPKMSIFSKAVSSDKKTKGNLLMDTNIETFVNTWINNKKGRKIDFNRTIKVGGKADVTLTSIKTVITLLDLGFALVNQAAAPFGEQFGNYAMLGAKKMAKGSIRIATKKGQSLIEKNRAFVGKSLKEEFTDESNDIVDTTMKAAFVMYKGSNLFSNQQFFLASLTDKEFNSGIVSPKRLSQIKNDMGRMRVVEGSTSIVGSTSIAKLATHYKTWAVPILTTLLRNVKFVSKEMVAARKAGDVQKVFSSREMQELIRVTLFTYLVLLVIGDKEAREEMEKDKSFVGKMRTKIIQENLTLLGAIDPEFFLGEPRALSFFDNIGKSLKEILLLEEYVKTQKGEYKKGDLKGLRHLQKTLTPNIVKQFSGK